MFSSFVLSCSSLFDWLIGFLIRDRLLLFVIITSVTSFSIIWNDFCENRTQIFHAVYVFILLTCFGNGIFATGIKFGSYWMHWVIIWWFASCDYYNKFWGIHNIFLLALSDFISNCNRVFISFSSSLRKHIALRRQTIWLLQH